MTANLWTIEADRGPTHPRAYLAGIRLVTDPARADQLPKADAMQLAEDWNSRAITKGYDVRYKISPAPQRRYIDMTPTWAQAAQIIAAALEHGTDKGRDAARAELFRMARLLDELQKDAAPASHATATAGTEAEQ